MSCVQSVLSSRWSLFCSFSSHHVVLHIPFNWFLCLWLDSAPTTTTSSSFSPGCRLWIHSSSSSSPHVSSTSLVSSSSPTIHSAFLLVYFDTTKRMFGACDMWKKRGKRILLKVGSFCSMIMMIILFYTKMLMVQMQRIAALFVSSLFPSPLEFSSIPPLLFLISVSWGFCCRWSLKQVLLTSSHRHISSDEFTFFSLAGESSFTTSHFFSLSLSPLHHLSPLRIFSFSYSCFLCTRVEFY